MTRITISAAAKRGFASRPTLYRAIKDGRLTAAASVRKVARAARMSACTAARACWRGRSASEGYAPLKSRTCFLAACSTARSRSPK